MDHAQGRAFHHHLARAIMHLNFLAGLLPFFEPSIECDDPLHDHPSRVGHPNPPTRGLHTFVPMPAPSTPPTMVSHGGIPTHMVVNPEPHLRPLSIIPAPREAQSHHHSEGVRLTPAPAVGNSSSTPVGKSSKWGVPGPDYPRATTRITTPVPVRSKQRAHSVESTTTKEETTGGVPGTWIRHRSSSTPSCNRQSTSRSQLRWFRRDLPPRFRIINTSATTTSMPTTTNPTPVPDPPPGTSTTSEPINRAIEPAGNPSCFQPWTDNEDKELVSLKSDTRSRPSWKTIGARLRRDPQVCKMRWAGIKQLPEHQHRELPSHEPEAEDWDCNKTWNKKGA